MTLNRPSLEKLHWKIHSSSVPLHLPMCSFILFLSNFRNLCAKIQSEDGRQVLLHPSGSGCRLLSWPEMVSQ